MSGIRAVVVDPDAPKALVRVAAVSLNRGEVRRAESSEPGFRPGWDLAGTVERAAADGSGPQEGSRVVGFLPSGAWAELVARRWGRSPGGS
jgi:NADPH:quinone reductase